MKRLDYAIQMKQIPNNLIELQKLSRFATFEECMEVLEYLNEEQPEYTITPDEKDALKWLLVGGYERICKYADHIYASYPENENGISLYGEHIVSKALENAEWLELNVPIKIKDILEFLTSKETKEDIDFSPYVEDKEDGYTKYYCPDCYSDNVSIVPLSPYDKFECGHCQCTGDITNLLVKKEE